MKHHFLRSALVVAALSLCGQAWAEPTFTQKAAAEALFQEGAKLYQDEDFENACRKFEASHALDQVLGTTLRLADCYDRVGKTASAWAAFQAAAAMAQAQNQPEREEIASERAEALAARLTYLKLELDAATSTTPGVKLLINDAAIPAGTWDSPIPVDPGSLKLEVQAPGYEPWSTQMDVKEGAGEQSLSVPALVPVQLEPEPTAERSVQLQEPPKDNVDDGSTQRVFAYISGGLGLVALGAGGYFGYQAYSLNDQSLDRCLSAETNACDAEGKRLRDDAREQGTLATITSVVGVTLVGVSAVLLLTAGDENNAGEKAATLSLSARATAASAGLNLEGSW